MEALAAAVADLANAGDVEGAKIAHEALGRLLGSVDVDATVIASIHEARKLKW